jgi:hypothetical protein
MALFNHNNGRSETVWGGGLALVVTDDHRLILSTVSGEVKSFDDPADAWRALDELDAPDGLDIAA